jgi:hypothetical protein
VRPEEAEEARLTIMKGAPNLTQDLLSLAQCDASAGKVIDNDHLYAFDVAYAGRFHRLPQIVSRGFVQMDEAGDLLDASRKEIKRQVMRGIRDLRRSLVDFFYGRTQSRPVVLPRFIQV